MLLAYLTLAFVAQIISISIAHFTIIVNACIDLLELKIL